MTKMLASVTTIEEAERALLAGADILAFDLSAMPPGTGLTAEIVRRLSAGGNHAREIWISFGGNWIDDGPLFRAKVQAAAALGAVMIEIAAPPADSDRSRIKTMLAEAALPVAATLFADRKIDPAILHTLFEEGFRAIMLDTSDGSRLFGHMSPSLVSEFAARCRALGLRIGFSAPFEQPDVPRLLQSAPDILGFRAPYTDAAATGWDVSDALRLTRSQVVDHRRRETPREEGRSVKADQIFVSDFVLPVEIGAYRHEHGQPQKVRFDVKAFIQRGNGMPREMGDVVSYDLILDGIRTIVSAGHVTLAETLAEEIAAMVLGHPRVLRVVVRVQKLELGAGGVGVEIERQRSDYGF